jgi:hypothetical protein
LLGAGEADGCGGRVLGWEGGGVGEKTSIDDDLGRFGGGGVEGGWMLERFNFLSLPWINEKRQNLFYC